MSRSARAGGRAEVLGATTGSIPAYQRTLAHLTVRARLLTAVVMLAALAVMIAGGTAFALQARATDARIDNSLARAVAALRSRRRPRKDPSDGTAVHHREARAARRASATACPARTRACSRCWTGCRSSWAGRRPAAVRLEQDPALVDAARRDPRRRTGRRADDLHTVDAVPPHRGARAARRRPGTEGCSSSGSTARPSRSSLRSTFLTYSRGRARGPRRHRRRRLVRRRAPAAADPAAAGHRPPDHRVRPVRAHHRDRQGRPVRPRPHGERDARPPRARRSGRSASSWTTSATSCARR